MTDEEFNEVKSIVEKEIKSYEDKILKEDSQYLYNNVREIYATKFISDCLLDENFMLEIDYKPFKHKKLLQPIVDCYLEYHGEIREDDVRDLFEYYEDELKTFFSMNNESEM